MVSDVSRRATDSAEGAKRSLSILVLAGVMPILDRRIEDGGCFGQGAGEGRLPYQFSRSIQ